MTRDPRLPQSVYIKAGRYYHVAAEGKRRIWRSLTRVSEGMQALYSALADLLARDVQDDRMPALIVQWQREVGAHHSAKTRATNDSRLRVLAEAFAEFRSSQVEAPDVAEFLRQFRAQARTHNQYRSLLRELMRYSIEKGYRTVNPVSGVIRTVTEKPRTRYLTDSEVRRIKVGAIYGDDGKPTRSGRMIAALIEVAYLTGQDIGMLLRLRWERDADDQSAPFVGADGLFFRRSKVAGTTGAAVLIKWTPRLSAAVAGLRAMHAERLLKSRASQRIVSGVVFTRQDGLPFTYSGAQTAWKRAVKRAGIKLCMFRDLRAKALTDKEAREGMESARDMGQHSTDTQTADYVRLRGGRKTGATR